ncbi:MAG TPA: VOC family protein [Acidimicrobiales bacterium]
MPTRTSAPKGAPCWTDLWTSDVDASRAFYGELFGWEAQEPSPEFGGYFMWHRDGIPVAGGMGQMGPDMPAQNIWTIYLATDDIEKALEVAETEGAAVTAGAMPVADLGIQAILDDPTGARVGLWQAGTFPGFTVLEEHGAPAWSELHTREHAKAVGFYRAVLGWGTVVVGDSDEFRYTVLHDNESGYDLAGIMDASGFLPEGVPAHWSIYWAVDDARSAAGRVVELGGAVIAEPEDTPYGVLATVTDPAGAVFKLRQIPQ